jgi:hypothetical protein
MISTNPEIVPNQLTIFINTRIRNNAKFIYQPSMTVPNEKSDVVFFDPLVKLSNSSVNNLENNFNPNEKFTQFFNISRFDSLINRTVSSYYIGEKQLTLQEATQKGYVDNNIRVTLDQLFKPNNIFYMDGKPYTIYSYDWSKGNWVVDKKGLKKKLFSLSFGSRFRNNYPFITNDEGQKEYDKLKSKGEDLIYGPLVQTGYSKFKMPEKALPTRLTPPPTSAVTEKIDRLVFPKGQFSFFRDLINVDLVNSNDNLSTMPASKLILYEDENPFANDLSKYTKLNDLYTNMNNLKAEYLGNLSEFNKVLGKKTSYTSTIPDLTGILHPSRRTMRGGGPSLFEDKKTYDEITNTLCNTIESTHETVESGGVQREDFETESIEKIQLLSELKKKILDTLSVLIDIINKNMVTLKSYYLSVSKFYEEFLKVKLLEYKDDKTTSELYQLLIEFDINIYSKLYFSCEPDESKIADIKSIIENKFKIDNYSYSDKFSFYYDFNKMLKIEKRELDICIFRIYQYYLSINKKLIKINYLETNEYFEKKITDFVYKRKNVLQDSLKKYVPTYYLKSSKENSLDDLKKAIATNEELKINVIKFLNSITVYSKFSLITMSRHYDDNATEKNLGNSVYKIKYEMFYNIIDIYLSATNTFFDDTESIENIMKYINTHKVTPQDNERYDQLLQNFLIFGDLLPDNSSNNLDVLKNLIDQYQTDDLVESRELIEHLDLELDTIYEIYKDKVDQFIPKLSFSGILTGCETALFKETQDIFPQQNYLDNYFNNFYEGSFENQDIIDFFDNLLKLSNENNANENIYVSIPSSSIMKWTFTNNWKILHYLHPGDSIFASVSYAFNKELLFNNKQSNNQYSEKIDKNLSGYYTADSIRRAVAENFTIDDYNFYNLGDIQRKPMREDGDLFLFDENSTFIGNDIDKLKANMAISFKDGGKFYRSDIIINKIKDLFKINIVVLNEVIISEIKPGSAPIVFYNEVLPSRYPSLGRRSSIPTTNPSRLPISKLRFKSSNKQPITQSNMKKKYTFNSSSFKGPIASEIEPEAEADIDPNDLDARLARLRGNTPSTSPPITTSLGPPPSLENANKLASMYSNPESSSSIPEGEEGEGSDEEFMKMQEHLNQLGGAIKYGSYVSKDQDNVTIFQDSVNKEIKRTSLLKSFYQIDCQYNIKNIETGSPEDNYPSIFLIKENDDYSSHSLLFTNIEDELERIIIQIIVTLGINYGTNMDDCIKFCNKSLENPPPSTGIQRAGSGPNVNTNEIALFMPQEFATYDVVKTVNDNNNSLHTVLLALNNDYRNLKFEPNKSTLLQTNAFFDISQDKIQVCNFYKAELLYYMVELGKIIDGIFAFQDVNYSLENASNEVQDITFNFSNNDRMNINIYQYFANYFRINFLIYNSTKETTEPDKRFVPFYVNNTRNNKKWAIIYQIDPNSFLTVCKGYKFLFDYEDIENKFGIETYNDPMRLPVRLDNLGFYGVSNRFLFNPKNMPYYYLNYLNTLDCPISASASASATSLSGGAVNIEDIKNEYSRRRKFDSKLSYFVIVDMELYPGDKGIPTSQKAVLSCQSRYEKIKQAFSQVFGVQYKQSEFNSALSTQTYDSNEKDKKEKRKKDKKYGTRRRR